MPTVLTVDCAEASGLVCVWQGLLRCKIPAPLATEILIQKGPPGVSILGIALSVPCIFSIAGAYKHRLLPIYSEHRRLIVSTHDVVSQATKGLLLCSLTHSTNICSALKLANNLWVLVESHKAHPPAR